MVEDNTDRISIEAHNNVMKETQVKYGDLLLSRTGTVGKCAILYDKDNDYNIAAHLIAIRIRPEFDSEFIASFYNSEHGKLQSQRIQRGTIIQGLSIYDLPGLVIPNPNYLVQTYIGNKVRQAEQLRERARGLEKKVSNIHLPLIPSQTAVNFDQRSRQVSFTALTERLDSHFYPPSVESYLKSLAIPILFLGKLCITVTNGQTQEPSQNGNGVFQATVANLSSSFTKGPYRWVEPTNPSERYLQEHDLLFCNAAHSKSYVGRDITYFQGGLNILPSTEVMVIRVNRSVVPASYIRCYLLTQIGYLQLQSTIRGITAHSYSGDVKSLRIPVPVIREDEKHEWFTTDDWMLQAGKCVDFSELLTTAAKLLVEALIEGKVTEEELQLAQEGIERGDDVADRAILGRLTRKGMDVAGEPKLFPDLDALYEALNTTQEEE